MPSAGAPRTGQSERALVVATAPQRDDARMRRIHFVVTGRVQGVGFRACTQFEAQRRGLVGCVWNRADGAVEGHAEGPPDGVESFAEWLRGGPRGARVDRVLVEDVPALASERTFDVRRGRL